MGNLSLAGRPKSKKALKMQLSGWIYPVIVSWKWFWNAAMWQKSEGKAAERCLIAKGSGNLSNWEGGGMTRHKQGLTSEDAIFHFLIHL